MTASDRVLSVPARVQALLDLPSPADSFVNAADVAPEDMAATPHVAAPETAPERPPLTIPTE